MPNRNTANRRLKLLDKITKGIGLSAALWASAAVADPGVVTVPGEVGRGTYFDYMKTAYAHSGLPFLIQLPLTTFDSDYELHGMAAKSWAQSEDGLVWTFTLQDGLSYSDGTALSAEDYVFALQRAAQQGYDFGWYWEGSGGIKGWAAVAGGADPTTLGVKAIDNQTLEITTDTVKPYLPSVVSVLYPVPRHLVAQYGDDYALNPDTLPATAAMKLESWDKGSGIITYVKNEDYTGPWPATVEKVIVDPSVAMPEVGLPAFMAGEIDLTILNAGQIPFVEQRYPDQIRKNAIFATSYLAFDVEAAPFDNPLVRRALYYAVDREELTNTVLRNLAVPAGSILPPSFPGYNPEIVAQAVFDPAKAKAFLAEAGYPEGAGFPEVEIWYREQGGYNGAISAPMLQYLQAEFKEHLGITMNIKAMPIPDWQQAMQNRTNNLFLAPYEYDYVDPSNFYGIFYNGGRHHLHVDEYDALVAQADASSDWDERFRLYGEAEQVMIDQGLIVPLVHPIQMYVVSERLSGPSVDGNKQGMTPMNRQNPYFYTHLTAN